MLKVNKVTRSFSGDSGKVTAVDNVSFSVPDGEFASIIGKSGSGKSTLLALLGALDLPTSGSIEVDGRDITKIQHRKLNDYRCKEIGFVFQNYHLVPNLTALENVMIPMELAKVPARKRKNRASKLLEQVGLGPEKHLRKPGHLSGGEQQRVAIARAIANKPKLILADEPTGNLDSATGKMVFELLHRLSRTEGVTVVAVTHDLEIAGKTDRAFRLSDGKLIAK